jgi:hypothetical protein
LIPHRVRLDVRLRRVFVSLVGLRLRTGAAAQNVTRRGIKHLADVG